MKILIISLSTTIQRTLLFNGFQKDHVNRSEFFIEDASGKAINTARILTQLQQGSCETICALGKENYKRFLKLTKKDSLSIIPIKIPGNTRECWTLLSQNGSTTEIVADEPFQKARSISSKTEYEKKIKKLVAKKLKSKQFDMLMISGSCPKSFTPKIYAELFHMARISGILTFADFHGETLKMIPHEDFPTYLKINEDEYSGTFIANQEKSLKDSIIEQAKLLKSTIIVTRGKKSTFASQNGSFTECNTQSVLTKNTTACGDSFNAGFIYGLMNGFTFEDSLKKGTECASLNAQNLRPGSILQET